MSESKNKKAPESESLLVIGTDNVLRDEAKNPRAVEAFQEYLTMGDTRSIKRLALRYFEESHPAWMDNSSANSIEQSLYNYSTKYNWANRVRLSIARRSAQALGEANRLAGKKRDTRLELAEKMMTLAGKIFDKSGILDEDTDSEDYFLNTLQPEEARKLLKVAGDIAKMGMEVQRAEIKETLERIKPTKPVEDMTDEELHEFIQSGKAEWSD